MKPKYLVAENGKLYFGSGWILPFRILGKSYFALSQIKNWINKNWYCHIAGHLFKYIFFNFQNTSLTWDTDDPEFTSCFEKTVLVWGPCLFLWLFSGLEIYYITSSKKKDIPWNWLNIFKLSITSALCILMISDFVTSLQKSRTEVVPSVDIYTPLFKLVSLVSIHFHY